MIRRPIASKLARLVAVCGWVFLAADFATGSRAIASDEVTPSTVKSDEIIILFPTIAHLPKDADQWEVSLHGWIFEKRHFQNIREWWSKISADDDDDDLDAEVDDNDLREISTTTTSAPVDKPRIRKRDILKQRSHYFLVDNERGKRIALELAGERCVSEASAPNGHFRGTAQLDRRTVEVLSPKAKPGDADRDLVIPVRVDLDDGDDRLFTSDVFFLRDRGVSVVSDIDDTIKITEVLSKRACSRNTFLRPFRAVPGMADLYKDWSRQGATLHYVSACPWQLYEPLREFMAEAGFPAGPMVMKLFRWKDRTVWDLFDSPEEFKVEQVGAILERFPNRHFILVGDSGQSDPEAYGALARRFPRQVKRILIRSVPGGRSDFNQAFRDLPREKWQVFTNANEIKGSLEVQLADGPSQPTTSRE